MTVVQLNAKAGARGPVAQKGGVVAALDIGSTKISCLIAEAVPPKHRNLEGEERNGLRMLGATLGLELGVVTVEPAHLQNLSLAIERAHLTAAGFVMAPYASAKSVLADDELALGVTVIDMGGATTSFAIFFEGSLVFADV